MRGSEDQRDGRQSCSSHRTSVLPVDVGAVLVLFACNPVVSFEKSGGIM